MWHAIGRDRIPLRKQFLESIIPPFVAILRRWRPLLAGVHDFTSPDGQNPLVVDDRALSADALPLEVIQQLLLCVLFCMNSILLCKYLYFIHTKNILTILVCFRLHFQ